ncbi:nuclear GTP-binding protein, partial [Nannochloropsis gaditana CCMP526]
MVKKKGKSKRVTFKQKYKIERRVKEHKRKTKKETRRRAKLGLPPLGIGQRKKEVSIPNAWPFKEQLLEELATAKRNKEAEDAKKKEEAALRRKQKGLVGKDVADLVTQAAAAQATFASQGPGTLSLEENGVNDMKALGQQSRRAFIRDLKEVVEQADVVLEVLDARDPLGSRGEGVEELILRKPNKKLVLVLNKVDLVPREVVGAWLAYLRRFHPTVAFKSATQEQRVQLAQHGGDASKAGANLLSRSGSVGAEALLQLLKNYSRSLDIKTSISVGVVGYPNVGKSSLINSLKRTKAAGVSSTPGFTRCMQEVQLDKHIKLLDSPGIVFDDSDVEGVLLRNCVKVDSLPDPSAAVGALLQRCEAQDLMMIYALPAFDATDVQGFLALLARKMGKLLRGGVPDRTAAARVLLQDWNTGKVPFYTKPPPLPSSRVDEEAQLVGSLGTAFEVGSVLEEGDAK